MSSKTIFIIVITVLVTVVLMNNTEEIDFWLFGNARIPKLTILGAMFGSGLIVGVLLGRPRKKAPVIEREDDLPANRQTYDHRDSGNDLTDEDREYIR